ncbi:hypothetical protein M9Y10_029043 [Tritrichomonas musculus]|uniref:Uncharacterized protein n=1 Tax=Tritrichomonas musculus TaxID=1915356 RepID=A0ABR2KL71_9EUKA
MEKGNILQSRITSLASYLRSTVEQLHRDRLILQLTGGSVNSNELSQNMVDVFQTTITSDREKYIDELISKLAKIKNEKGNIEVELSQIQLQNSKETDLLSQENEQLKAQVEALESKRKNVEWKQQRKEKTYRNQLKEKETQVMQFKQLIDTVQDAEQTLFQKIKEIRSSFAKLQRNQIRLLNQAKTMCTTQIIETIELAVSQQQSIYSKKEGEITQYIDHEKRQQEQLTNQSQQMLDILNGFIGDDPSVKPIAFSIDDFCNRSSEVREFINDIIEAKKKSAVQSLKRQVIESLPGINIGENQNITEAIDMHLKARIKAKEIECQKILKESEQREALLKQKLKEAIEKIQKLQDSESDFRYMEEFDKQKTEWENNYKKLDETMSIISKSRTSVSSASRSTISNE